LFAVGAAAGRHRDSVQLLRAGSTDTGAIVLDMNRDLLVVGFGDLRTPMDGFGMRTSEDLLGQVAADPGGGRVVEDHGGWQGQPGRGFEAVAQLDGGQRVEAEVWELGFGIDVTALRAP
jgi:hypothetical protein